MKSTKTLLLFLVLISFNSCKSYDAFKGNPFYQGCSIRGEFGKLKAYEISDYLKGIRYEVNSKIELPENLNEILLTETVDGGNGNHEVKLILFNETHIIPVKIDYQYKNRKAVTTKIQFPKIKKRNQKELLRIFNNCKTYGEWNIFINCLSLSVEQTVTFYIKEKDNYLYLAKFENFYFTKYSSLGIDNGILNLINILEDI